MQLPQHRPLVFLSGGVAGLADGHTEGGGVQRELGNERGAPAGGGLDRTPQGFAVTHQLIETCCATRDLGDRPVTDRGAQGWHAHLLEDVAERGIRGGRRSSTPNAAVSTAWWRMANRSRSRKLSHPLRIPSTATSSRYQAGNRTPRRIRASGINLR